MQTVVKNIPHCLQRILQRMTLMVLLLLVYSFVVYAQEEEAYSQYEIDAIHFEGNDKFKANELADVIKTKETPGFISKFFHSISKALGSESEYLDDDVVKEDVKELTAFYLNHSYFKAKVTSEYKLDSASSSCEVVFIIHEGVSSLVDSIVYQGLTDLPHDVFEDVMSEPLLKKGDPYQPPRSQAEIVRIMNFLAEVGYPQARFDKEHSGAFHHAMTTGNFDLVYTFVPGKRFQFGESTVFVEPQRDDITPELVIRHLDYSTGEQYGKQKMVASERNLNRLNLFETVRIEPVLSDSSTSPIIPTNIFVRPRDRHEISPEISVSDENNTFNLGLGVGYTNRNFLGDARLLTAKVSVRAQSLPEWNIGRVIFQGDGLSDPSVAGAVELQFQISQPYIFSRKLNGVWTSSISSEKQKEYTLGIVRSKIGISNQFAAYTYGLAEWTLERVDPKWPDTLLNVPLRLTRQENQRQFNSILTLTLQRDKTNDLFSPTEGFFNSITMEESGILPKLLNLDKSSSPYTEYYKLMLFGRWYHDLSKSQKTILAYKGRAGYQDKYGDSYNDTISIPLNRRFFGGGSGSVRGWRARDLGAMPDSLLPFGGNFLFEWNAELRVNHFRGMGKFLFLDMNNIWGVYFIDAGNVWNSIKDFRVQDIAVAAGFGYRYETLFGPFRIDYGFRLYDPKEPVGKQFVFQKRFWADVFGNGVIHFGIGHAF